MSVLSPASLLAEELAGIKEFVALLRTEQAHLVATESEPLVALAEQKTQIATRLTNLAQRRHQMLAAAGLGDGRPAMDAWLAKSGNAAVRRQWDELLAQAAEARNLNETNGKLIGLQMQHNQQALSTLLAASNRAMTYGPDGQQRPGSMGRLYGSA